jgi:hypothetical protein
MARCGYCGTFILFGGLRDPKARYCNERCRNAGRVTAASLQVPDDVVRQQVWALHRGPCPKCRGRGPVDVHVSYWVWSAILLTRWGSTPALSCRSCARKRQLAHLGFSVLFGWWGFPWGLILTPLQILRNVVGLVRGPDDAQPSPQLAQLARLGMATHAPTQPS